jgi:hypothetical protein
VVRVEKDNRIGGQSLVLQLVQPFPHQTIHQGNEIVQAGPVLADLGQIRMIGRELNRIGIDPGRRGDLFALYVPVDTLALQLAFMGDGDIEDGEEGLARRSIPVVSRLAGLIPDRRVAREVRVVIFLAVVGAVIPRVP